MLDPWKRRERIRGRPAGDLVLWTSGDLLGNLLLKRE